MLLRKIALIYIWRIDVDAYFPQEHPKRGIMLQVTIAQQLRPQYITEMNKAMNIQMHKISGVLPEVQSMHSAYSVTKL